MFKVNCFCCNDKYLWLFLGSETLLAKLYSFIDTDEPLNPLLASFFSKIIGVLLIRKSDQVIYLFYLIINCQFFKNYFIYLSIKFNFWHLKKYFLWYELTIMRVYIFIINIFTIFIFKFGISSPGAIT